MAGQEKVALNVSVVAVFALVAIGVVQMLGDASAAGGEPSGGAALLERIRPVGQLNTGDPITLPTPGTPVAAAPVETAARGSAAAAPAAVSAPAASASAKPAAARTGEQVYNSACVACHGTGAAGAPKIGDKTAWAPRIKQGNAVLVQHAVQGFTGKTGMMPPRGTCGNCSDQELKNAVEYMVSKAK